MFSPTATKPAVNLSMADAEQRQDEEDPVELDEQRGAAKDLDIVTAVPRMSQFADSLPSPAASATATATRVASRNCRIVTHVPLAISPP
jgi:hypothetical protein